MPLSPPDLFAPLATLERSSSFVASGTAGPAPTLRIDGFGLLPLPVVHHLLAPLCAASEPAPYGRGPDTLVDPDVRRCHQVSADRIHLPPSFQPVLDDIVARACTHLGVQGHAEAHLYKLLVYGPGDFFVPHRDTEKEDGMFATLVVTLPSDGDGAALRVEHGDEQVSIPLTSSLDELSWLAFYADCRHEVLPLQHGIRVALVFNLVRAGAPTAPTSDAGVTRALARHLEGWSEGDPVKLVYVLEHRYTEAELGWDALKGADHARAHALRNAASQADVVAHLALLSVQIEWSAEELQWRSRRGRWGRSGYGTDNVPDDLELYDLVRDDRSLECWIGADGQPTYAPPLPLHADELYPDDLEDIPPDDVSYHEATGNEGASLLRSYRRAVVTLWPARHAHAILVQQGPEALLDALPSIDAAEVGPLVDQLLIEQRLSGSEAATLASTLLERGLLEPAKQALLAPYRWHDDLHAPVARFFADAPQADAEDVLLYHHRHIHPRSPSTRARLLYAAAMALAAPCTDAVTDLLAPPWRPGLQEGPMAHLVVVAWHWSDPRLRDALRADAQASPEAFDSAVLATLQLDLDDACPPAWRQYILNELEARTATAPVPPPDARRAPIEHCRCAHCLEVNQFLTDPEQERLTYGVAMSHRRHLDSQLHSERIDVVTRELKQGSPHKLVITKTNARHEQAARRHVEYLDALDALR